MYPVSDAFLKAIATDQKIVTLCEVYDGTDLLATIPITGGSVNIDASAVNKRRCNVSLNGEEWVPKELEDLLHTSSGHELKVYRGVVIGQEPYDDPYYDLEPYNYKETVLANNPVGYWRLNEVDGTIAYDSSGNEYDGTYQGAPTLGIAGALASSDDTAVDFNGTSYISIGLDIRSTPESGSFECWVDTTQWAADANAHGLYQNLGVWSNSANNITMMRWSSSSSDAANFYFRVVSPSGSIQDIASRWRNYFGDEDGWHHVVGTWDTTHMRLYVDGVEVANRTCTPPDTLRTDTQISRGHDVAGVGHEMDEAALYDYALTAEDIAAHYEAGANAIRLTKVQRTSMRDVIELVPQGTFNIEDCDIEDSGESVNVNVKGFDRSKEIQRRRFTDLYFIDKDTNYATAIRDLLESRWPGLKYNFPAVTHTTPSMVLGEGGWSGGGDPWVKAQEMATDIGMELFFNPDGSVALRPVVDPTEAPVVAEYVEGPKSTLLYASRSLTKEDVFNHVVVVGNHSGLFAPIRAHATDDDPASPTYIGDPNGETNLAFGIPVRRKGEALTSDAPTNGITDTTDFTSADTGADSWIELDLGKVMRIDRVKVWHYWGDGRTYYNPRTEVSEDGIEWTVVAEPANYAETSVGHVRNFTPIKARYVRDYISGNTVNTGNQWVELEVYAISSPYGDVPTFHRSTSIFTQAQGEDVANAELLKKIGTPENVRFISVVNPAHDTGDVVRIRRERAGINSIYVLDKLNIPLEFSGSINASARERRVK